MSADKVIMDARTSATTQQGATSVAADQAIDCYMMNVGAHDSITVWRTMQAVSTSVCSQTLPTHTTANVMMATSLTLMVITAAMLMSVQAVLCSVTPAQMKWDTGTASVIAKVTNQ